MFQSIRNSFRNLFFGKDEFHDVVWNQEYRFHIVPEDEALTSAELQMLQRIVADTIFEHEQYCKGAKYDAQIHPVGDENRNFWFKQLRKHQAKLKKLSALQYRLKHKIAARG